MTGISAEIITARPHLNILLMTSRLWPGWSLQRRNLGDSGRVRRATLTSRLGAAHTTVKARQLAQESWWGMMAQASPATVMFPIIQKEASTLRAPPLLLLGWNSAK